AAQAEWRNIVIAWSDVSWRLTVVDGDDKQVRALETGVVVPMAIEEPGEGHSLHFGVCPFVVLALIASIAATLGINLRDEENSPGIGEPHGAVGLSGDAGDFLRLSADRSCSGIKVRYPHL